MLTIQREGIYTQQYQAPECTGLNILLYAGHMQTCDPSPIEGVSHGIEGIAIEIKRILHHIEKTSDRIDRIPDYTR